MRLAVCINGFFPLALPAAARLCAADARADAASAPHVDRKFMRILVLCCVGCVQEYLAHKKLPPPRAIVGP